MGEELSSDFFAASPRLALKTDRNRWRVPREVEDEYGIECPDWVEELPVVGDDWRRVRDVTKTIGLYTHTPSTPAYQPRADDHRPSTVFENEEKDMRPSCLPLLREVMDGDVTLTEFPYASNYRTDVVVGVVDNEQLERRISLTGDDEPLNQEWKFLKGHRYLRENGPMKRDEFVNGYGPYVEETNRKVWNWLDERNLLASTPTGYYTAVEFPIHMTAHAVELKQRDWQKALEQVLRSTRPENHTDYWAPNRSPGKYGYADYQWVGMDAGQIPNVLPHLDEFREHGVGLLGIARGGVVKLLDAERKDPPERSLDREHVNEKVLQALDVEDLRDRGQISTRSEQSGQRGGTQAGLDEW